MFAIVSADSDNLEQPPLLHARYEEPWFSTFFPCLTN